MRSFNEWLSVRVTRAVGSMWCAYAFAALALSSLRENLDSVAHFVMWLSTTFLQLVLLSVVLVGQNIAQRDSEVRATETHDAVMEELTMLRELLTKEGANLVED